MVDKDLGNKVNDRTLETAKQEFDISEVFRGANLSKENVVDFYKEAVANPTEAREKLISKMAEYDSLEKQVKELVNETKYYTEKLDTGFDLKKASFGQKTVYNLASLIPVASWRQSAKQKVANTQKEDVIDNILIALRNLNDLTITTNTLIKNGYTEHGKLRNLADNDYLKQQEKAVQEMNKLVPKIMEYTGELKTIETRISEIKGKDEFKEEYILKKKELGALEDTLFQAKQDLVKRTVDYNVTEDCFYQAEIMIDKLKNITSVMEVKNYEVSRSTTEVMKLMPAKVAMHKLIESGEGLVTLKDQLTNILRAQEVAESEKMKYLAQIVASDIETGIYAPIQKIQIEMNEETRRIIEATHAYIVQEARSGARQKMVEELKEEVKTRQETTYNK